MYHKKTFRVSVCTVSAAAANILLNLFLLPRFGYKAAAYTTAAAYLLLLISHYFAARNMGIRECYNNKYIMGAGGVMSALAAPILAAYYFPAVRRALAALYALILLYILLKKRKDVAAVLRMLRGRP
jgi:O-antigen/teichoic acid export membrane protein